MLENIPLKEELVKLMGDNCFKAWEHICNFINQNYNMETIWNKGGKGGIYECKFRKNNKTLCALYARKQQFGFMIIFGKAEREKFELVREEFSKEIQHIYDESTTYHDGKWMMIEVFDNSLLEDIKKLILIKKKVNKKTK